MQRGLPASRFSARQKQKSVSTAARHYSFCSIELSRASPRTIKLKRGGVWVAWLDDEDQNRRLRKVDSIELIAAL